MLLLERQPCRLEALLGVIEARGAPERYAGDVHLDVPEPDPGHALAPEADAPDALPVIEDVVVVHADHPHGQHWRAPSADKAFGEWCEDNGFGKNVTSVRPIIDDVDQLKRRLTKLFQVRHVLVHEFTATSPIKVEEVDEMISAVETFLFAAEEGFIRLLVGFYPLTQVEIQRRPPNANSRTLQR